MGNCYSRCRDDLPAERERATLCIKEPSGFSASPDPSKPFGGPETLELRRRCSSQSSGYVTFRDSVGEHSTNGTEMADPKNQCSDRLNSEKKYHCQIVDNLSGNELEDANEELMLSFKYKQLHFLRPGDQEEKATTIFDCLQRGLKIIVIGQGTRLYTESEINCQFEHEEGIACLVLTCDQQQTRLTPTDEDLIKLKLHCTTYWMSAEKGNENGMKHFSAIDISTYKLLKHSNEDFRSRKFEEYLESIEKCSMVKTIFERRNIKIKVYAGRKCNSGTNSVTVVAVPLEYKEENYQLKECFEECKGKNVIIEWANNEEEDMAVCKYLYDNDTRLSKERKNQIREVINIYTEYLMKAHSNLSAIKASAIRSSKGGKAIEEKECIILSCIGKGVIPLLEKEFPKYLDSYRVDVREDLIQLCGKQGYSTNLKMGLSIGVEGRRSTGTLGPFVEELDSQNNAHCGFLTCSHVCYDLQTLINTPSIEKQNSLTKPTIIQPSSEDSDMKYSSDMVFCGTVHRVFFGNVNVKNSLIGVDCAHVNIENSSRIPVNDDSANSETIGEIEKDISDSSEKLFVYKRGRTTGETFGQLAVDGDTNFKAENMHGDCGDRFFTLYQQCEVFSHEKKIFAPGDSGAAALLRSKCRNELLGIVVGGTRSGTRFYVSPINAVQLALGAAISIKALSFDEPMDVD